MSDYRILVGDCREMLRTLPERSVQCVVTSPPYFGLRDYGLPPAVWGGEPECAHEWTDRRYYTERGAGRSSIEAFAEAGPDNAERLKAARWREDGTCAKCGAWRGQLGLEPTPDLYVEHMVDVFREVWRVLRDDGVLWLNLGDSYANDAKWGGYSGGKHASGLHGATGIGRQRRATRMKPKDLIGIPWRVAFALQGDGWTLRSAAPWLKRAAMPESVEDRPSSALEYVFLLTKRARYFWDAEAVRVPNAEDSLARTKRGRAAGHKWEGGGPGNQTIADDMSRAVNPAGRNRRNSDWWYESLDLLIRELTALRDGGARTEGDGVVAFNVNTVGFPGAHFAVMPPSLVEPCILAGTSERGCCPECGAPYVRIVERGEAPPDRSQRSTAHYDTRQRYGAGNGGNSGFDKLAARMRAGEHGIRTTGWRPGCDCNAGDPVPCTVLDPFAGSGTVGMVATGRGRRAILIDLNPKYADIMRDRCGPLLEAPTPEVA